MPKYTVRIQLHEDDDYGELHEQMELLGFKRTVVINRVMYDLPWGSYSYNGSNDIDTVLKRSKLACERADARDPKIVVTESTGRRFYNLDLSEP